MTHKLVGRCDVHLKCVECSAAWTHGLALPDHYVARFPGRPNQHITWRDARAANDLYLNRNENTK